MSDQNDDGNSLVLMVAAAVAALIAAGVIALVLFVTMGRGSGAIDGRITDASAGTEAAATAGADEPAGRVYFAIGSDALPTESSELLVQIADAARARADKVVLISGFHDASGDAAQNAELAKRRAQAVRHALEANGVAPDRLVLDKPALTEGGADAAEARRVELRLR